MTAALWEARTARKQTTDMQRFISALGKSYPQIEDYDSLYKWSLQQPELFWQEIARMAGVRFHAEGDEVLVRSESKPMLGDRWFAGWTLNYAEHLLLRDDESPAIIGIGEAADQRTFSRDQLRKDVAAVAAWLRARGIGKGDRVGGVMANTPEAIVAMLAATSLGAIWSSCSPDFGAGGIVDRLGQVEPKCVFFTSGYTYAGKFHHCQSTIEQVQAQLPSVKDFVLVPIPPQKAEPASGYPLWSDVLEEHRGAKLSFTAVPFDHPLFIMFSSGTTGVPKCIVHGHGGTLLQHVKELSLHSDIKAGDRLFYFTTCGWMMWNWMVTAIGTGATVVTYDGSVTKPHEDVVWRFVGDLEVTHFGTSPKYLSFCMNQGITPAANTDLSQLRTILSTGSPLLPEHYDWVYERFPDLHLASISGGTDIISCFMLGNPLKPVYPGEIQGAGLGMALEAWNEDAQAVMDQKGELVCVASFPSMPVGFWRDEDGTRYKAAYFDFYVGDKTVWHHGDYIEINSQTGGVVVYGRSDATLNPGGVRIGTAEIYRQVEVLAGIADSICVGVPQGDDVEVVLFVKMAEGSTYSAETEQEIKRRIRAELTPRHVPKRIYAVKDIPYTRSGKKVEIAVNKALQGQKISNLGALKNPEALDEYHQLAAQFGH